MKPKLKVPESERLKPKCDVLLSTPAFKFDLRRYNEACARLALCCYGVGDGGEHSRPPMPHDFPRAGDARLARDTIGGGGGGGGGGEGGGQGLTLVHFSAQPGLFLTQNTPQTPPYTP